MAQLKSVLTALIALAIVGPIMMGLATGTAADTVRIVILEGNGDEIVVFPERNATVRRVKTLIARQKGPKYLEEKLALQVEPDGRYLQDQDKIAPYVGVEIVLYRRDGDLLF